MKMSTVATGVVVATMSICALLNIGCAKENTKEIIESNEQKQAVTETYIDDKDSTTTYIDDRDVNNTYIDDRDVQNNYYEYSYDKDYFNNDDKIKELEEQINELEKAQQSEQPTIIEEEKKEETIIQSQTETSQFTQQTSNNMEPNMVTCDHCGRQGELYENITRWYSTNGDNHFTHAYCIENYIESTGVTPAQDLPNLR